MKLLSCTIVIAMSFLSTTFLANAASGSPPQQKILDSSTGRFVFGQISEYRRDQYMLDTQTGRLWQIVTRKMKNPDGSEVQGDGASILEPVPYLDLNGQLNFTPK